MSTERSEAMTQRRATCALLGVLLLLPAGAAASNIANPGAMLPAGRISVGASYHVGGYTITNEDLGCIVNRFHARIAYSPLDYLNFGIDLGTTQMDVDSVTLADSTHFTSFQGNYGFSGGLHLKAATPRFFNDMMAVIGGAEATIFTSENDEGASYGGIDVAGVLGLQFRIPKFGFVSAGAKMYYIEGTNKPYNSDTEGSFSNTDNLQGWLAVDFLPSFKSAGKMKGMPYFSAEMTLTPGVSVGDAVPLKGISFSIGIGWVSPKLYGEEELEDVE
jgi:hypothetical protein